MGSFNDICAVHTYTVSTEHNSNNFRDSVFRNRDRKRLSFTAFPRGRLCIMHSWTNH